MKKCEKRRGQTVNILICLSGVGVELCYFGFKATWSAAVSNQKQGQLDFSSMKWACCDQTLSCDLTVSQHASALEKYVGEFVLLPCEFPTFEMDEPSVLWSRYDLNPSTVHQRQLSGDKLTDQNKLFSGRTFMVTDALETGDLNLNLTNLHLSDSGIYTCIVKTFTGRWRLTDIKLQVKGQQQTLKPTVDTGQRVIYKSKVMFFVFLVPQNDFHPGLYFSWLPLVFLFLV